MFEVCIHPCCIRGGAMRAVSLYRIEIPSVGDLKVSILLGFAHPDTDEVSKNRVTTNPPVVFIVDIYWQLTRHRERPHHLRRKASDILLPCWPTGVGLAMPGTLG